MQRTGERRAFYHFSQGPVIHAKQQRASLMDVLEERLDSGDASLEY